MCARNTTYASASLNAHLAAHVSWCQPDTHTNDPVSKQLTRTCPQKPQMSLSLGPSKDYKQQKSGLGHTRSARLQNNFYLVVRSINE